MDKLAVELLTLIAFLACTDGGPTGCNLSLVSRRIREASRPARFFSVSLITSPTQIEQFLDCLQKERSRSVEMLPRVRHLCLSLSAQGLGASAPSGSSAGGPSSAPAPAPAATGPPKSRAEFLAAMQRRTQQWGSTQNNLDEQYNRILPTLIRTVAPDLYTLALIQMQWRSSSVVRCFFPSLRELTIVGGDPRFLPFAFVPKDRPLYPSMKRLHHILAWVGKDIDFDQWAVHAPNVTHLRISRLDYQPRGTVDTLEHVISSENTDDEEPFPHLQRVMIEPHPAPPPTARMTTAHIAFRDFLTHLDRLAERARVPVKVLPPLEVPKMVPGVDPTHKCIQRVKREWLERVESDGDGAGCWLEGMRERSASP
ncbi:hypothetical protein PYCCODRAFT_1429447 [Trametes coccinea BRFM310]|uniref:F-box domain-containing protein n=1 Tax=Trametes coccinea (strain BRFM310) TaxID=1353009 RepID=A0A1Y2J6G5_TRAC3|nr:hypothetical protein PYCCODRAFT_1429447 [Trametes coccinea BRFM310]